MNLVINNTMKMITEQQKEKENTAVFMVGEQLKEIIGNSVA